ncbi:lipid droplet-regulating VLDL assembly factor AUP1 [Ciona intestinalis]
MVELANLVPKQRIESTLWSILVFCYIPLGVLLMLIRIFLTLNYFCMQVVFNCLCTRQNKVRRIFEKIFLFILGVAVNERNEKSFDNSSVVVLNHLSRVDGYFIAALCNLTAAVNLRVTGTLISVLRCLHVDDAPNNSDINSIKELLQVKKPVLVFPEPCPTNGAGLLKFRDWPFNHEFQIQPMVVRMKRPFPISGSTLDSVWWSDLLWSFFCPLTIYDITILPTMRKNKDENSNEFKERIRKSMSSMLDAPCTNYDASDVVEYLKRVRFEERKPQEHLRDYPPSNNTMRMAEQVKDILPHVPIHVIISDVERTKSVDITVTNILEGVVTFVAEEQTMATDTDSKVKVATKVRTPVNLSFSRDPNRRHMTLQERKDEFIAVAKEKYITKHGL